MTGADGGFRQAGHQHRIKRQALGAVVGQHRRTTGAEIQDWATPLRVGLRLLVGHDALGAQEVSEETYLGEGREEDRHAFVAEQSFAQDLHEPAPFIGFVRGQVEEGGLAFGLEHRHVEAEGGALILIGDELTGQLHDVGAGPIGRAEVFLTAAGAEGPEQFAGLGFVVEGLLEVVGDRHVAGGQAQDREAFLIEVLALVHQRRIEHRGDGTGLQVRQELLADAGEVGMPLGGRRWRSD